MKKILVKAALPTLAESGHGWDDISALRWIPTRREKTFAKPLPIVTPEKRSSSEDWEKNIENQIDFQNKFGDRFPHVQPSNPLEKPVPIPHWKNPKTVGTFVAPATQQGIPADTTIGPGVESTLLGILGERGKPGENFFWRTPRQGAMFESEGEGFKFGGYDPKSFVKIPTSQKLTPMKLDRYNWALENPVQPPQKIMTQSMINEIENLKNRFPDVPTRDIWGPSTLEINPLMEGFHPDDYKVAGEPMDLAWRLLKAQQTIDAYSRENVEEGFEPNVQNVIIASKPGAENISAEEQSRLHDGMLRRISELEGSKNIRIMSARGRSQEWGDENSLMLSNVPDDMLHEIHSLAGEFNQDSILHSPKGMAGTQFVDSSGESEGGLESGSFTEEEPPNYTEFPTGQKYAYGNYVAVNKGQDYHPSVGGYLQQQQQIAPSEGSTMMDPENPGGEISVQEPMNVGYDGRPLPDERVELGDWFWDDMLHADGTHNQWDRLSSQERDEVKERVTSGLHGLLNSDGSWNDWALKNLKHESPLSSKSGPSVAFRTHLYGPDGFRQHEDGSNGDSIIAVVNSHSKRDKRGGSIPGLRTVMLRNSEFMGPKSQVFKPRGHDADEHQHGVDVRNVMQHHGEQKNNQPVSLHGVKRKQKQEWKRRFGRGGKFRKSYPVYVLNQLGDVLVKDRVSPEAKRHKLEYDTAYEASPERRKYRADLNRERRRRGMYGDHSGRDISHTEGGKLTVEGAHENRARHFKDQGTLRHVGVKKKVNDARKANLIGVVPPLKGENE